MKVKETEKLHKKIIRFARKYFTEHGWSSIIMEVSLNLRFKGHTWKKIGEENARHPSQCRQQVLKALEIAPYSKDIENTDVQNYKLMYLRMK